MKLNLLLASALVVLSASAAAALTRTFDITASDFVLMSGTGVATPVDPVTLDFTLTWDPTTKFGPTTTGLTINSFTLTDTSEVAGSAGGNLVIGSDVMAPIHGPIVCGVTTDTYCVLIQDSTSGSPVFVSFYQGTSDDSEWVAQSVIGTASPVPEASTWSLMLVGFAGLGWVLRSGRRTMAAA